MNLLPPLMCLSNWVLAGAMLAAGPAGANVQPARAVAVAESALSTGAIIGGILNYTLWPGEARPLQVCVSRGAADAAAILTHLEQSKNGRPLSVRAIEPQLPLPSDCDAIYFEAWEAELQRAALRSLAAKPVLTMGRGPEFCSDGGLFCLEPGSAGLRFEVNLEAVARSGLRVNPLVLRLARPRAATPS